MYNGLLGLHSLLRWAILLLLVLNILRVIVEGEEEFDEADKRWSLRLLVSAYINLGIGIYEFVSGDKGVALIEEFGWDYILKYPDLRFWVILHPLFMLVAISLIVFAHRTTKLIMQPAKKHKIMFWLWVVALFLILFAIPWPFRNEAIARPYFRGLY